jgi:peptidoglycan/LPS O-acetylase OafA/YrhL
VSTSTDFSTAGVSSRLWSSRRTVPQNQAHLHYRPEIDGLRAIAVLPVVFYHSALGFPGGYVGVDVFFVISGYLITKIIYDLALEKRFSLLDFYSRRIRRLFPALFTMLLAVTCWSATHMIWTDLRNFGGSLVAAATYLANVFFYLSSGYFVEAARTRPLLHTWSLGIEEQFYIIVPFLIFGLARFVPRRLHVPLIAGLSVLSFALCVWLTRHATNAAFYLLPSRAWELGLGGALAIWAPPVYRFHWLSQLLCAAGVAAILFAVLTFGAGTPFPGWAAAFPTMGTAAVLSAGGKSGALIERLLATPPFTFVGKISYSLYLWHWPVIVAFTYSAVHPITPAQSLLAIAISFVLAVFSWRFVEQPFRTRRLLPTARQLLAAAAIASFAAIAVGETIHFENGFPQRYPSNLVALLDEKGLRTKRPDCFSVTPERVKAGKLCVRGAPGVAPAFILVGDSHAGALSDGLFAAAASRGLAGVQFTANGVVPLIGVHSLTNDVRMKEPLTHAFLLYLRAHPELRTVIVAGFWYYRATGRSYRHPAVINVDSGYDGSGTAYDSVAFRHGLERLVDAFPERRFIFLDDTPSGDDLSLRRYLRAVYNGLHPEAGLARASADAERAAYEPILQKLATSRMNVSYAPVLSQTCGPKLCPLFESGRALFLDGDHLTRFGSMQQEPALGALFDQLRAEMPAFKGPLAPRSAVKRAANPDMRP